MEEGVPIESRMISKRIEGAQKAVEAQNFESRKHLLEYDDVMNKQREAVYGLRRQLLEGVEQRELILEDYVGGILSSTLDEFARRKRPPRSVEHQGHGREARGPVRPQSHGRWHQPARALAPRARRRHLRSASRPSTRPRKRSSAQKPCVTTSAWSCSA